MCKILIAGDVCPQNRVVEDKNVFNGVKKVFNEADFSIINLEAPIRSFNSRKIEKRGPNLETPKPFLDVLKNVGVNMVTLANNHFLDYGSDSAICTIQECEKKGIRTVGGGENIEQASKTVFVKVDGCVLAIINCCEHEYSIATETSSGSNPLDPIKQYYAIIEAKKKADFVIVIIHGGIENYQLPSPRMKKTYRFFIDCGADAVVNHHQHCFSGYEIYKGKPIFYGLGNLCFDWPNQRSTWYEGIMVMFFLEKEFDEVGFRIEYYKQAKEEAGPVLYDGAERAKQEKIMEYLNSIINNDIELSKEYDSFMDQTDSNYDYLISPWSISYTLRLYKKGLLPSFYRRRKWLWLQNALTCESHYERFLHMINNKLMK